MEGRHPAVASPASGRSQRPPQPCGPGSGPAAADYPGPESGGRELTAAATERHPGRSAARPGTTTRQRCAAASYFRVGGQVVRGAPGSEFWGLWEGLPPGLGPTLFLPCPGTPRQPAQPMGRRRPSRLCLHVQRSWGLLLDHCGTIGTAGDVGNLGLSPRPREGHKCKPQSQTLHFQAGFLFVFVLTCFVFLSAVGKHSFDLPKNRRIGDCRQF